VITLNELEKTRVQKACGYVLACFGIVEYNFNPEIKCGMTNCTNIAYVGLAWKPEIEENRQYVSYVCQDCLEEMKEIASPPVP